jgi:hypothetical protein
VSEKFVHNVQQSAAARAGRVHSFFTPLSGFSRFFGRIRLLDFSLKRSAPSLICAIAPAWSALRFGNLFATPGKTFRRNRQMNDSSQNEAEMKELKYEKSFGSTEGAETSDGTNISMKDPDTMLTMTVLLLACLALAVLAHVVV